MTNDLLIIFQVGGTEYTIPLSNLLAYPKTRLGAMFTSKKYDSPLRQTDKNEFFIDRDEDLFHYVCQFYRDGKITWYSDMRTDATASDGIDLHDLINELAYFQIPISSLYASPIQPAPLIAAKLVEFIMMLKTLVQEMTANFVDSVQLSFYDDKNTEAKAYGSASIISEGLVESFTASGFQLLSLFEAEIRKELETVVHGQLKWKLSKIGQESQGSYYSLAINIPINIDREAILKIAGLDNKSH